MRKTLKNIATIAQRSILSDDSLSVLVPILEDIVGQDDPAHIRAFFESRGLQIQEWDKVQTDFLTFRRNHSGHTTQAVRSMEAVGV